MLVLYAPGRNEDVLGILRIDCDMIENIIVAAAQVSKPAPVAAAIGGRKNCSRAGSQKDVIRIVRIVAKAADVSTIRPQNRPLAGP